MRNALRFITMIFVTTIGQRSIPSVLLGHWVVGTPYDVGQPIGLNANQESKIKLLEISLSTDHFRVCDKDVPVKSINIEYLSKKAFLERCDIIPDRIGLRGSRVVEVTINALHSTKACGDFGDPGSHLFISDKRVVIEAGNEYFPLKKAFSGG